jgi:hypothetical protein
VLGSVAVGKRLASKELANTFGPPTLYSISLGQKIGDCFVPSDENQSLTDERRFEDISVFGEAFCRKIRITEKANRFKNAGDRACAGQGT